MDHCCVLYIYVGTSLQAQTGGCINTQPPRQRERGVNTTTASAARQPKKGSILVFQAQNIATEGAQAALGVSKNNSAATSGGKQPTFGAQYYGAASATVPNAGCLLPEVTAELLLLYCRAANGFLNRWMVHQHIFF